MIKRNFCRLKIYLPARYAIVEDEETRPDPGDYRLGVVLDLGGGGIRLMVEEKEELHRRTFVRTRLSLPTLPNGSAEVHGMVVSHDKYENSYVKSILRICFLDVPEAVQDAIVRYVYEMKVRNLMEGESDL